MGCLILPVARKSIPPGAEILERNGERTARWRDAKGKVRTAEVRATRKGDRIVIPGTRYLARFKDGVGVTRTVATGVSDMVAARRVLCELERRSELVRSGVLSVAEDAIADHRRAPVAHHIDAYVSSLAAGGCTPKHCRSVKRRVTTLFTECRFRSFRDVKREAVETWLTTGANLRRSARTRNTYTIAAKSFLNWAVEADLLLGNPLARIKQADENADRRRQPRALAADEVQRLLDAAQRRPLAEARLLNRGWRKNQPGARLRPETVAKLELLGRERALVYKTLLLTGLRLGELASIRVCDVILSGPNPHIVLAAKFEKNRQGSHLPLRADLCRDLTAWIARGGGDPQRPLFAVSQSLLKVFDRDLKLARIPKRDDRNRTACLHSLRYSMATLMSRGGVAPRITQAAMRHSSIDLTMSVYTDPRLLDVAGALRALPELPLEPRAMAHVGT